MSSYEIDSVKSLTQLTEEKENCYIFNYVGEPPFSTELSLMVDRAAFRFMVKWCS